MTLNRDRILAARPKIRPIDVPAWGGEVLVRGLSVRQLLAITQADEDGPSRIRKMIEIIAETVCDEQGRPILSVEDVAAMEVPTVLEAGQAIISASNAGLGKDEETAKNS